MIGKKAILAIVIVVVLIAAGGGYSYYHFVLQNKTPSSNVKTSLVVDESQGPDSLDPAVTYTTPGWEPVNQIYQGLVAPNGTSFTGYIGDLASSFSLSSNLMNYTFHLRQNVTFSNGDPYNAYVQWYSMYRTLLMNQAPAWILGQNFNYTNYAGFSVTVNDLNTFNFSNPTQAQLNVMEFANQSFQVVNKYEIILHLGYGYNGYVPFTDLYPTLVTPMAAAVDPIFVSAHGGVTNGTPNSYMVTHTMGTGFYMLKSWIQGQSVTLVKNDNYWANNLSSSELNDAIQPAILQTIIINYKSSTAAISDLKSGAAQMIIPPSVKDYSTLKNISGVTVKILGPAFWSSQEADYIYMDPVFAPFNNTSVRMAISYAIDYKGIIKTVFDNLATQWVGPIPPGFPFYNESKTGLSYYKYNPTKAANLLASAGYQAKINGTTINPSGKVFPTVNFLYTSDSVSQTSTAQILQSEFAAIGITIKLVSMPNQQYQNVVWSYDYNTSYPMGIAYYSEDYTASSDYVDALAAGYYVGTSFYWNWTVFNMTVNATSTLNSQHQIENYTAITQAMYNSYWLIWTFVPYFMSVHADNVVGMIPNPLGSGAGYFVYYNTVHYST